METTKDLNELLRKSMSLEEFDAEVPDIALLREARLKVMSRKQGSHAERGSFLELMQAFVSGLRFYHVGVSAMLVFAGFFYLNDSSYQQIGAAEFIQEENSLSVRNTTVSVNSTTMLTCIPTLVIRN